MLDLISARRRRSTRRTRGFTLVELLVTVAIIGVLAAIATIATMQYLAHAKAAEAKAMVGAMSRAAQGAYERGRAEAEVSAEGAQSAKQVNQLCGSSNEVPAGVPPQGTKYQPDTADGSDYNSGDVRVGWKCLRYESTQPQHFQYKYTNGFSVYALDSPAVCNTGVNTCYEAAARGDLLGDGEYMRIARTGAVNPTTGALKASTVLYVSETGCSVAPGHAPIRWEVFLALGLLWLRRRRLSEKCCSVRRPRGT